MEAERVSFFSQLPVEITTDILSRLPVGSVIRCKLVCKTWQSLVEDPVFLDIHTHRLLSKPDAAAAADVTTNTDFYFSVQMLEENRQKYRRKHYFGEFNNHEMMSNSSSSSSCCCFKLSKPLNAPKDDWHPIGSSNGLICSYGKNSRTIYVYNPCTRECIRLPPPPIFISSKQFDPPKLLSGFGYNPLTNEYKVVQIRKSNHHHDEKGIRQPGAEEVCVYTLGSGKWRRTSKLESSWNLKMSFSRPGVFFNGALHWITWKLINFNRFDIFSFDLADEEFRIMDVPSPPLSTSLTNIFWVELGLWGGCCRLCVMQWNHVTKTTDIWVLMNNNSKDKEDIKSWTMKFKIPATTMDDEENNKLDYNYHPIALLGRDKILLRTYKGNESVLVSYDSETGNFEDEVIDDDSKLQLSKSNWGIWSVTPYMKSFVSLKSFREEDAGEEEEEDDAGLPF